MWYFWWWSYSIDLPAILDITTIDENGKKRPLYADSAYRSIEQEEKLKQARIESYIHEKGARNRPLTEEKKESNHIKGTSINPF